MMKSMNIDKLKVLSTIPFMIIFNHCGSDVALSDSNGEKFYKKFLEISIFKLFKKNKNRSVIKSYFKYFYCLHNLKC